MDRVRWLNLALVGLAIALGLSVHLYGAGLGQAPQDFVGDALWAAMIAWAIGAIAPNGHLVARSVVAYACCVAVEFSQLYHATSLDAIRATRLGHLVLGSGFDLRDLLAYAVGVGGAALVETMWRRGRKAG